jgi:competence protein ComEC
MPLLWLSLAFLCGILLGELINWGIVIWLILAGLCMIIFGLRFILARRFVFISTRLNSLPKSPLSIPLLLCFLSLGAARYQSVQPDISSDYIAWYNNLEFEYVVEGILVEPADVRDSYTNLRIRADRLHPLGENLFTPVEGLILARVPPGESWHYGDRIRIQGELATPPEDEGFSYREYLARQGIHSFMPNAKGKLLLHGQGNFIKANIYNLREKALKTIYLIFPDPEASLLAGILLGVESNIPEDVQRAFNQTGTAHIIAISGFNITILAALFTTIFVRILGGRRRLLAAGLTTVVITVYTVLVGADAAVVRAAVMGAVALLAALYGRRQEGINTLAFVAALMALFNPNILWDLSFLLSFFATLGLVLYADPLSQAFKRFARRFVHTDTVNRLSRPFGEYILFTLAAQLTTLGIVIYNFQRLSLSSLVANPAILPAQPPVMILGGIAVILGMLSIPTGKMAALLAWPFVVYTIRAVEFFARFSRGVLYLGDVALFWVILFYVVLLTWTFAGGRIKSWLIAMTKGQVVLPSRLSVFILLFVGLAALVVWRQALSAPNGRLHLFVLDVNSGSESGDGILVQSPGGRNLLINGGPSTSRLSDSLGRRLPLLGRGIDYLVVASVSDNQLRALSRNLERYKPGNVLWAGSTAGSRSARFIRRGLRESGVPIELAETGQALDLGEGALLRVISVSARGAVLELEWKKFRILLPLGMDFEIYEKLLKDNNRGSVTALILAENGYAPLNTLEWIRKWNPQMLLLSVAPGDREGLPDRETMHAVEGYTLLRTDDNGWIHLSTDGEQMWVEVERR